MRAELAAIGEALIDIAAARGPIDVKALGDLMLRFALVYGRYVNAGGRA